MVFKHLLSVLGLTLASLLILGCERQPDVDELRREIEVLLEREFIPDVFEVSALRRMGSQPGRDKTSGDQRLTVFFNAELRFRRDFDLSAWDGPNASALAFLLGATEKGVTGVKPGGNRANDVLRVHGSRIYALRQGQWRPLLMMTRRTGITAQQSDNQQLLNRINQLTERAAQRYGGSEQTVINRELSASLTRIERQLDQLAETLSVASGPAGGAYHRYLQVLEDSSRRTGFKVRNLATQGSVENCQLVQGGAVDLAIVQSNVAALAIAGKGPFSQRGSQPDLRALAALFPEYLQIVVAADAGIDNLAQLKGSRIDIGLPDSGTRVDALRLLSVLGLTLADFKDVQESGLETAVAALRSGELDAFMTTLQVPGKALQNLIASGKARLLPLSSAVQDAILAQYPTYRRATIAAHSYPHQTEALPTLSVTATLITRADLADSRAGEILQQLFTSAAKLARENLRLTLLTRETAREDVHIPMHPAAISYFAGSIPSATDSAPINPTAD